VAWASEWSGEVQMGTLLVMQGIRVFQLQRERGVATLTRAWKDLCSSGPQNGSGADGEAVGGGVVL
jgi:hypothetical protein